MIIVHTKKQYDDNAAKRKKEKGLTEDEYLSGMKKTDKIYSCYYNRYLLW